MADDDAGNVSGDLSNEKRQLLIQFQEIVAIDSEEESLRILEKHNWNLEVAVQSTFNENEGLPPVYSNETPTYLGHEESPLENIQSSSQFRPHFAPGQSSVDVYRQNSWLNWMTRAALLPFNITHAGYSFCYHCISEFLFFFIRIFWPGFGRDKTQPIDDILKFKKEYEETYGSNHPTFYLGSYSQVLNDAKKELKFLLVYLHCKEHQSTPNFCHAVLSNPGFIEYINGNMLFWGCDVNTNEGFKVSRAMRETTYPFLAIVCLRDNRMTIVWRIEGPLEVDELISICAQVIDENEPSLVAARSERQERSINQELRNEQDTAYLRSLEKDKEREKEKQKLLEVERQEEELRLKQEEEKEREIRELALRREQCRRKFADMVEPAVHDGDSIQIRFKLPDGEQPQRYFLKTDQLALLYDFVLSFNESPSEFLLNTNFPKQSFPIECNEEKTLIELGIRAPTTFFVQSLVDDEEDDSEED